MAHNLSHSSPIATQAVVCDSKKIEARELSEVMLGEQFTDVDQEPPSNLQLRSNAPPDQELLAKEYFFCVPNLRTPNMDATEKPPEPLNNAGDDGEEDDNRNLWHTLKAHYIDHPDDDLLVALIDNG